MVAASLKDEEGGAVVVGGRGSSSLTCMEGGTSEGIVGEYCWSKSGEG